MLAKIAFLHMAEQRFLVLTETCSSSLPAGNTRFSLATYDDQNTFIKIVATAGLTTDVTTKLIATVLLSASEPTSRFRWIDLDLSDSEIAGMGLYGEAVEAGFVTEPPVQEGQQEPPFDFQEDAEQFYEFLMQAPTPFIILSGPEHRMTFINPPYLRLIRRLTDEPVLGKTIREVFPDLEGQPYFGLLDRVYRTGLPYVGIEAPVRFKSHGTGDYEAVFQDFIYHPLRNKGGEISGIMVQSTDVTERVLSREAADSRENQLYTQWQELEAIYKTAPIGVVLFRAKDLTILRINDMQAEFLEASVAELQGKSMKEAAFKVPAFRELLERVLKGEPVKNRIIETPATFPAEKHRSWLVNITPFLDGMGAIEKLCSISWELPQGLPQEMPREMPQELPRGDWSATGSYRGNDQAEPQLVASAKSIGPR